MEGIAAMPKERRTIMTALKHMEERSIRLHRVLSSTNSLVEKLTNPQGIHRCDSESESMIKSPVDPAERAAPDLIELFYNTAKAMEVTTDRILQNLEVISETIG